MHITRHFYTPIVNSLFTRQALNFEPSYREHCSGSPTRFCISRVFQEYSLAEELGAVWLFSPILPCHIVR